MRSILCCSPFAPKMGVCPFEMCFANFITIRHDVGIILQEQSSMFAFRLRYEKGGDYSIGRMLVTNCRVAPSIRCAGEC